MSAVKWILALVCILGLLALACTNPPAITGTRPPPSSGGTPVPQNVGESPFGVMLPPQVVSSPQGMDVAKGLGVTYFRPPAAIFTSQWNGSCAACDAALQAGLKLVLTVRNGPGGLTPSSAPSDLAAYQKTLGDILDHYKPAVLVVENEENSDLFYTSAPDQYGQELKAACDVAHAKGVKCANGGMVSALVALLVWDHYSSGGDTARAQDFASRAFPPNQQRLLTSPQARAQIDKGKQLLTAYGAAGIDYLNFHWYIGDTGALGEAVAFLKAQMNLPLMSNETGQSNEDPNQTTAVMQEMVKLQVPIVVWYAIDGPMARGLVNPNGSLRPTGEAFRQFLAQNYGH